MKCRALLLLILLPGFVFAADQSPYAGEQRRSISSLSEREVAALRRGDGMGLAKLAELNHYPGPKHVLDFSEELDLSPQQLTAAKALYEEMRHEAVALGERIIEAEAQLDKDFKHGLITEELLKAALVDIGRLRAELRHVHLRAHLHQRVLLRPEQIRTYDQIRGYDRDKNVHGEHSTDHHR